MPRTRTSCASTWSSRGASPMSPDWRGAAGG
jgi:hypothetical protein